MSTALNNQSEGGLGSSQIMEATSYSFISLLTVISVVTRGKLYKLLFRVNARKSRAHPWEQYLEFSAKLLLEGVPL